MPNSMRVNCTASDHCSGSVTSRWMYRAWAPSSSASRLPSSSSRSASTTLPPRATMWCANAAPRPPAPPVMMATFPVSCPGLCSIATAFCSYLHIRRNLASRRFHQGESLVAGVRHLGADVVVRREPTDEQHEAPWFSRHVGAHVPGVCPGEQCRLGAPGTFCAPTVHGAAGGFHRRVTVAVEVGDGVCDPIHLRLRVQHHVRQHRRRSRA